MIKFKKWNRERLHTIYKLKDGTVVPGVTTVIGQLGWSKGALIGWTRRMMQEGKDPFKVKEKAIDIGTLAHFLIHCDIIGVEADLSEFAPADVKKAENCLLAYWEWAEGKKIEIITTECEVVSEEWRFGGTIDVVARINGILGLMDFKSSDNIYPENKIQLASYGKGWDETHSMIEAYHLLQLGKEDGSFHHHYYTDLSNAWTVFRHLREIYDLKKKI